MKSRLLLVSLFVLAAACLAGCSPYLSPEQPACRDFVDLAPGSTLGQTFTSRFDGLQGVLLVLRPVSAGNGQVVLRLRPAPESAVEVRKALISLKDIPLVTYYQFPFNPLKDSNGKDYYAELALEGSGRLQVCSAAGPIYRDGAAYAGGQPLDGQLTLHLAYLPRQALAGLLGEGLGWLGWIAVSLFLFVLPGWGLLGALASGWDRLRWPEKLGLATGVSLALYPLLMLWSALTGLRLGALVAWLPPLAGLGALAWQYRQVGPRRLLAGFLRQRTDSPGPTPEAKPRPALPVGWATLAPDLALVAVIALIFGVRLWAARGLAAPMWGDSVHHSLITQLLLDHGGLFNSWQPYAELQSLTYHFGFHSLAAVFAWITRLPAGAAVLITGQILNALAVLALYPLATRLGRSPWAGVAAVLVAGLLSPMPSFYINWGRYTQLAGQAALPAAAIFSWDVLQSRSPGWKTYLPAWLALAGLGLLHYRILVFAVLFLAAAGLLELRRQPLAALIRQGILAGLGAGLLFLPWFVHLYAGRILTLLGEKVSTPAAQMTDFAIQYNSFGDLLSYLPLAVWLLMIAAAAWAALRRERSALVISLWWLFNLLAANPQWLRLPGSGAISSFAVLIALYIPAGVLIGAGLGWLLESRPDAVRFSGLARALPGGLLLIVLALGIWGARLRLADPQPEQNAMVTRADLRAMAWIRGNTPPDAGFLINSFFAYGGTAMVGSDAGWWLPLLAGRRISVPPATYGLEQGPRPDYPAWVNRVGQAVQENGLDDPVTIALLKERGLGFIYLGQLQGTVNAPAPGLDPQALLHSLYYTPVYHQDRVWIFALK